MCLTTIVVLCPLLREMWYAGNVFFPELVAGLLIWVQC